MRKLIPLRYRFTCLRWAVLEISLIEDFFVTSLDLLDKMTKMSRFWHDDQNISISSDWLIYGEWSKIKKTLTFWGTGPRKLVLNFTLQWHLLLKNQGLYSLFKKFSPDFSALSTFFPLTFFSKYIVLPLTSGVNLVSYPWLSGRFYI